MLALYDARIPAPAADALAYYATALPLRTEGVTDALLSGHPDLFCFARAKVPVIAPNMPLYIREVLDAEGIVYTLGLSPVGPGKYRNAAYNVVASEDYWLHNTHCTEVSVRQACAGRQAVHVKQSFARCTTFSLHHNTFVTSDPGIYHQLERLRINGLFVDSHDIQLPGVANGFIGGCVGVWEDTVVLIGGLKYFAFGEKLEGFLRNMGYKILELYQGPLFDGGSLCFL